MGFLSDLFGGRRQREIDALLNPISAMTLREFAIADDDPEYLEHYFRFTNSEGKDEEFYRCLPALRSGDGLCAHPLEAGRHRRGIPYVERARPVIDGHKPSHTPGQKPRPKNTAYAQASGIPRTCRPDTAKPSAAARALAVTLRRSKWRLGAGQQLAGPARYGRRRDGPAFRDQPVVSVCGLDRQRQPRVAARGGHARRRDRAARLVAYRVLLVKLNSTGDNIEDGWFLGETFGTREEQGSFGLAAARDLRITLSDVVKS